jgi:hypothetical protein
MDKCKSKEGASTFKAPSLICPDKSQAILYLHNDVVFQSGHRLHRNSPDIPNNQAATDP